MNNAKITVIEINSSKKISIKENSTSKRLSKVKAKTIIRPLDIDTKVIEIQKQQQAALYGVLTVSTTKKLAIPVIKDLLQ